VATASRPISRPARRLAKLRKLILITVVVPTYRRPDALVRCIRSLVDGVRGPEEIIVIGREGDLATRQALAEAGESCKDRTTLRTAWVSEPGHLPPVSKGLELSSGDIVAFVDDDVTATPEWLAHLVAPFADPGVGVAGGRVITPASQSARRRGRPGHISWYGKHWGNVASLDGDSPVEVEAVMECNWAWRRDLLASLQFDPVLNFDDASMYGLDLCMQARAKGFRVLYEPRAVVHHHVAPRVASLDRSDRTKRCFAYSRNYTYIMLKHLPRWKRPVFVAWWFVVGERGSWGLAAMVSQISTGRSPRLPEVWSALRGKVEGILLSGSGARAHV
jgi:GT2 family glycosyltransferase